MILAASSFAQVGEHHIELPLPTVAYGIIAIVIFMALLIVVWSFRDVANRHSTLAEQRSAKADSASDQHSPAADDTK